MALWVRDADLAVALIEGNMKETPQQYGYVVTWDNNEEPIVVAGTDFVMAAQAAYYWLKDHATFVWPIKSIERIGRHA